MLPCPRCAKLEGELEIAENLAVYWRERAFEAENAIASLRSEMSYHQYLREKAPQPPQEPGPRADAATASDRGIPDGGTSTGES